LQLQAIGSSLSPAIQEVPFDGVGFAGFGLHRGPEESAAIGTGEMDGNVVVLLIDGVQLAGSVFIIHDDGIFLGALANFLDQAVLQMLVGHVVHIVVEPLELGFLLLGGDVGAPLGLLLLQAEELSEKGLEQILQATRRRHFRLVHGVEVLLLADSGH